MPVAPASWTWEVTVIKINRRDYIHVRHLEPMAKCIEPSNTKSNAADVDLFSCCNGRPARSHRRCCQQKHSVYSSIDLNAPEIPGLLTSS
jgi:hypothetical protein